MKKTMYNLGNIPLPDLISGKKLSSDEVSDYLVKMLFDGREDEITIDREVTKSLLLIAIGMQLSQMLVIDKV